MRIAINGMGRIGRLLFKRLLNDSFFDIVAVNDIMPAGNLVYLLKYDSIYGHAGFPIMHEQGLIANGKRLEIFREAEPLKLPWKALDVDLVLECSGSFITKELASQHLTAGAKKVLLSTTGSDNIPLMIWGHNQRQSSSSDIISPGGCMTNCITHPLYLLNAIGIESAAINVIHSYTSRQELVDAAHKDFRRGRSAAESIIPVPVDLHHSLERLLPSLKNKITTITTRVPVPNGAFADISLIVTEEVSREKVNELFQKAAKGNYKGIIEYTEEPIVSLDTKANPHSCIIAGDLTSVVGRQVKLFAFFDNEFGYTSRMIDWMRFCGENI